eukprot:1331329-Amorphochlora_amoeboformis.AAC.2
MLVSLRVIGHSKPVAGFRDLFDEGIHSHDLHNLPPTSFGTQASSLALSGGFCAGIEVPVSCGITRGSPL